MVSLGRRARQRDRDQVLDALSIAFSESQISDAEHETRDAQALGASTMLELRHVIDDLQIPQDHPSPRFLRTPDLGGDELLREEYRNEKTLR